MATKIIKAWIDGAIQNIEVEEMTSPEQPLSVEERVDTLEGKHEVAISKGSMLVGDGTPELKEITPSEVLEHINAMGFATTTEEEYDALYKDDYNTNVLYMLTDGDDRADWSQTDETAESYIKNKPDIDGIVNDLNIRIDETKESIKSITPESIGAATSEHDHDDKYYTEFEIDEQLNLKSNVGHTHNSIIEVNKNVEQKFWRGTQSEYDALSNKSDDTMYIVIDGNDENTIVGLPNVNTAHDGKYLKVVNGTWVVDNSNYTDAEKKKLAGIADGATKTIIDTSLTQSGQAADAKTVGDAFATKQPVGDYALKSDIDNLGALSTKDIVSKSDLASDIQVSLGKADTAIQSEDVNTVLSQAKASGEFDGKDGVSPIIYTERDEISGATNVEIIDGQGVKYFRIYDGYTPLKEIDYFTPEEHNEFEQAVYNTVINSEQIRDIIRELIPIYMEYELLGGAW